MNVPSQQLLLNKVLVPILARFEYPPEISAPLNTPYSEGKGQLTASTAANTSTSGSRLLITTSGGTWSLYTLDRVAGRAALTIAKRTGGTFAGIGIEYGYCDAAFTGAATLGVTNVITDAIAVANNTDYLFLSVLRSPLGGFNLLRGGSYPDWTLYFTEDARSTAKPQYAIGSFNAAISVERAIIGDLGETAEVELLSQSLSGARAAGDTFTHLADGWVEFLVTALPSSGSIDVRFRVQDATNYMQVTINSSGNLVLNEVVSGTPNALGSSAAAIANGDTVKVTFFGANVRVMEGVNSSYTNRITTAAASNFQTATAGNLADEGTGGDVRNIRTRPRFATPLTTPLLYNKINALLASF